MYMTDSPTRFLAGHKRSTQLSNKSPRKACYPKEERSCTKPTIRDFDFGGNMHAFQPGLPALDMFPFSQWFRTAGKARKNLPVNTFGYGPPAGFMPLRKAIADHIRLSRAAKCEPEQIIIVNGSQQAIGMTAHLLLDEKDQVWMEDPGYSGAVAALTSAGAELIPVPVDHHGIQVDIGLQKAPQARLTYVTPSHQHPIGATLPLDRRLQLLEWARAQNSWILEDDYDSEYRYSGHPISSLQGLDRHGRVIYMGTFSKTLFPALRLGYLVVPPALVEVFTRAKAIFDRQCPIDIQAGLAEFITSGQFGRHLRRMRILYQERMEVLIQEADMHLGEFLDIPPKNCGMQVVGWLPASFSDQEFSARARKKGIHVPAVSDYSLETPHKPGLMMGFAGFTPQQIRDGIRTLATLLVE